LKVN
ncbi:hypothetical protein CP8484711_1788B, partial [Chlamydia psittaci 84-8471/1]